MSYVDQRVRPYFESLSIDLKDEILRRNVTIHTVTDLIRVLEKISQEEE